MRVHNASVSHEVEDNFTLRRDAGHERQTGKHGRGEIPGTIHLAP